MNQDLKLIKKHYGEKMMHLCRKMLPTILETEGLLPSLMFKNFEFNHDLYDDLKDNELLDEFRNFMYKQVNIEPFLYIDTDKTPEELLDEAGYILYECHSESEIQSFKRFYKKEEEICTFKTHRLDVSRVFFAIKKDVNQIKREDFIKPSRQDLYGTSVISIQFKKDGTNFLTITNRYNHRVRNPDATFSSNLDNIIPGLTKSFEKYYGIVQTIKDREFDIPNYVNIKGKYYKYNNEIGNIYYCPNNIIIKNEEIIKYPKEKYIVMDYFILDLQNKKIMLLDEMEDGFAYNINNINIKNIMVVNENLDKKIIITPDKGDEIIIKLNKDNQIISIKDTNIIRGENYFLTYCRNIEHLELPNLEILGDDALYDNTALKELELPKVKIIGKNFMAGEETALKVFRAPMLDILYPYAFCALNSALEVLDTPKLRAIGFMALKYNTVLKVFNAPNLESIGDFVLFCNESLEELNIPQNVDIGMSFLDYHPHRDEILESRRAI